MKKRNKSIKRERNMEDFATNRLSRENWLNAGLEAVRVGGPAAVRLAPLAKNLGVTTGSFYWHFEDISEYKRAILKSWETKFVQQAFDEINQSNATATKKLKVIAMRALERDTAKYNRAIEIWAISDETANEALSRVDARRRELVTRLLKDTGFEQEEAEVRAQLFITFVLNTRGDDFPEGEQWLAVAKAVDIICA